MGVSRIDRWCFACALVVAMSLGASSCSDDEEPKADRPIVNPAAYQGFFAHYLFGGRPVHVWKERLDLYAPSGAEADEARYRLTRTRAEAAGLVVAGEPSDHDVTIREDLLARLLARVDAESAEHGDAK